MDAPARWRSEPGSYLLLLSLADSTCVDVGRLGSRTFPPGRYVYAGSALGSGGVAGRVNRHVRAAKRLHWHIDYLARVAAISAVGVVYSESRHECLWLRALTLLPGVTIPVPGFGSSDCRSSAGGARCPAHLVRLPDDLPLSWIENELTQCPIQRI